MYHRSVKMEYNLRSVFGLCIVLSIILYGTNGARYIGGSPEAAGRYLDSSQNSLAENFPGVGHPRAHASFPNATGPMDSVEMYSLSTGTDKSGFLSRTDQNLVAHHALSHDISQMAMARLNNEEKLYSVDVVLNSTDFPTGILPKMKEYRQGHPRTPIYDIKRVVLVLRHFVGEKNNSNADVLIFTMFPRKK